MSALEAISMVMHGLTRGEYLPEYRFRPFPDRHFIDQAVRLCRAEADQKHVKIAVDLKPQNGNVAIQASEPHLQQAFNNLLHNAIKYSYRATESTQRYVSVRGNLAHNGYEVVITNYGVGIEPDEYDYIFQEGYRGRLTLGEYRTGSGQGLILVKSVIERHHGRITVTSQPLGEGVAYLTSFAILLPLEQLKEKQI
jgi:signal transduction histidine kinase